MFRIHPDRRANSWNALYSYLFTMRINRKGEKKNEGLVNINSLFDKYKKILKAPEKTVTNTFVEVVHDLYGISLKSEHISYSPNTKVISINQGGALKTEMKLHKKEILTHMRGRLGINSCPKDIL